MTIWGRTAAIATGIAALGAAPAWGQSWNMYSSYTDTVTLGWNNTLPSPVQEGQFPELNVTLSGNQAIGMTVDTGSTGIVVSQQYFTPQKGDVQLGMGNATYTSDHKVLVGTYWQTTVTVADNQGHSITSNVKILVVPDTGVQMMGVGFDRGGNKPIEVDGQRVAIDQPHTDQNPFLNIVQIDGKPVTNMRRGYVVSSTGVTLGLTAAQSSDFAIVKLTPNKIIADNKWNRPDMSLSIGGQSIGTGGLLNDTGIAYMIATPMDKVDPEKRQACSQAVTSEVCLIPKTDVSVVLTPGLPAGVLANYSFSTPEANAVAGKPHPLDPTEVNLRPKDPNNILATTVSLNTGLSFFMGFDYMLDFDGGYVGYKWVGADGAEGGVTPLISLRGSIALPRGFDASLPVYLADATTLQPIGRSSITSQLFGLGRDLEIAGNGSIAFNGAVDMGGGNFTVTQGLASINASLKAKTVTIGAAGSLSGSGTITGDVVHRGAIAPGNSIGTMNIVGTFTPTVGSVYLAEVNAQGQSDRIAVTGATTIQGGGVVVLPASGLYAPRTSYTILTATGGVTGRYSSVTSAAPFLLPSLAYNANDIVLTLQTGGFAAAAQNPNQRAVGLVLDASAATATGDFGSVLASLSTATSGQGLAFLNSISGQNYAGFSSAMVQGAQFFMNNFAGQAGGGSGGSSAAASDGRVMLGEACDVACDAGGQMLWGAWGGAIGGLGTIGAGMATGSVTYNLGGFATGLDRQVSANLRVGVTLGYATGTQWVSGFAGQGQSNTFQGGLYANYDAGPVYLDALAGYAYTDNRMRRSIAVPGLGTRIANGQTGANQLFGQLEGGYRFDLGGAAEASVTPFARLQAYTGTQNGFTESGAQSLDLSVARQTTNSLRSVLGAQLGGKLDLGWREKLALQLRLGWNHEYADTARPVTAALAGAPATPFTTFGIAPQRDSALLGFAASTAIGDSTRAYIRYEGNFSGQDSTHALTAGVRMTW